MWKDYLAISVIVTVVLIVVSLNNIERPDSEKISPYECGFEPYGDARQRFDISFYLIGILFIIFDLEVIFIFPFATIIHELSYLGYWVMMGFITILTIGFIYEWKLL